MSINNYNINTSKIVVAETNTNFLPNFKVYDYIKLGSPFPSNFSSQSSDDIDDLGFFSQNDSLNFVLSISEENNKPSLDELIPTNYAKINNSNISFASLEKSNLFTNIEQNSFLLQIYERKLLKKRFRDRRPRRKNQDNIRRKIKRGK